MTPRTDRNLSSTRLYKLYILSALAVLLAAATGHASSDWRHFRGPAFDGTATADWPPNATLEVTWKSPLGNGYSGIVVAEGRAYTSYASDGSDWLAAFDATTGEEIWRLRLGDELPALGGGHGGPSATPVVGDDRVYAIGGHGALVAVRFDGEEVWRRDLKDWGDPTAFGFTPSPLLVRDDGGAVLVQQAPSRDGSFVYGLDPATGEELWSLQGDTSIFQSPIVTTLAGRQQIVLSGAERLWGITARGEPLWSYEFQASEPPSPKGRQINIPLAIGSDRVVVRETTSRVVAVEVTASPACEPQHSACEYTATPAWKSSDIARSYTPPIRLGGVVYGYRGSVVAGVDTAAGERKAISRRPGDGFLAGNGDRLLILTKRGGLHLGRIDQVWNEQASLQVFDSAAWTPPTVADGAVFVRSMSEIARVDVMPFDETAEDRAWIDESRYGADLPDTRFGRFVRSLETVEDRDSAIDAFLAETRSFPIVEDEWAHFVFRSDGPSVGIAGDMVGERAEFAMTRIPDSDLFYFTSKLPRDAEVSYLFFDEESEQGVLDPRNSRVTFWPRAGSEFDRRAQRYSRFAMPGVDVPAYRVGEPPGRGRVETHRVDLSDLEVDLQPLPVMKRYIGDLSRDEQRIRVYLPAGYDAERTEPYPLVLVFAGDRLLEALDAKATLDHVLGDELPPAVVVFADRFFEFIESDASWSFELHRRALFEHVLPFLRETYRVGAETYYLSFGFGGPIAIRTAQAPESTARRIAAVQPFMLNVTRPPLVAGLAQVPPEKRAEVYLETSRIDFRAAHEDWNIADEHRKAVQDFRNAGWEVEMATNSCGFFWSAWTDRLAPALAFLLTGEAEVPE